jgi:hypothetical protein
MPELKIEVLEKVAFKDCKQMATANEVVVIGFLPKPSDLSTLLHYDSPFSDTSINPECVHPLHVAAHPYKEKTGDCFFVKY